MLMGRIYNSRNYKCFIDFINNNMVYSIYNSRNYKCFIDPKSYYRQRYIYNSRNYKCFIDNGLFCIDDKSTIVEITNVL